MNTSTNFSTISYLQITMFNSNPIIVIVGCYVDKWESPQKCLKGHHEKMECMSRERGGRNIHIWGEAPTNHFSMQKHRQRIIYCIVYDGGFTLRFISMTHI